MYDSVEFLPLITILQLCTKKERRRKRRQPKLVANQGESSYSSGKLNEVDPLDIDAHHHHHHHRMMKMIILQLG